MADKKQGENTGNSLDEDGIGRRRFNKTIAGTVVGAGVVLSVSSVEVHSDTAVEVVLSFETGRVTRCFPN